ncbi:MAG: condensation domain-containing protein, partial [Anaerolineae bacterium]|nr:condensation domain-containing protein [Anaerolineae bacterium]
MSDLFRTLATLTPEQRQLAILLLKERGVDVERELILPQPRPDGRAALSYAQQRLWFLDQLTPGTAMYNIPTAVRLQGRLDVASLGRALNEVVRRHEVLRTVFQAEKGEPVQVILPELTLPLPVADLTQVQTDGAGPEARLAAAAQLAAEEARQPFDLATGPLLRAKLLRLADDDHVLLFTMHHIVADGWSVGVLINEVAALYTAFVRGETASPLPPLPIQYADFAAWQRRWLQGEALEAQLSYWRERLAGSPPLLELPTDRPRPPVQTDRGAVHTFSLGRELSEGLKRLAQAEGATPFMALLAAFQVLLHRYANQDDICVGTPVANRTRAEIEPLIGFFANTLVIRGDLSANPSFRALLRQARERVIEAQAHQDVPFEMLVEELRPQRDMTYTPLFQAMLSYQQAALRPVQLPGLTLSLLEAHSGTAKFDLMLNVADTPAGFAASLEYNTDLFDRSTIERMAGH